MIRLVNRFLFYVWLFLLTNLSSSNFFHIHYTLLLFFAMCDNKGHIQKSKINVKDGEIVRREQKCKTPQRKQIYETPQQPEEPKDFKKYKPSKGVRPPGLFGKIGPKHVTIFMQFVPSMAFYTAATVITTIYICEWKAVLQYLPYYNGKYNE